MEAEQHSKLAEAKNGKPASAWEFYSLVFEVLNNSFDAFFVFGVLLVKHIISFLDLF